MRSVHVMIKVTWTFSRTCIVDRTYDEEIRKRINHLLRKRNCVQMERSESAIRVGWKMSENNGFLHKELENQNKFGEILWRARQRSLGRKPDESWVNLEMQITLNMWKKPPTRMTHLCRTVRSQRAPHIRCAWLKTIRNLQASFVPNISFVIWCVTSLIHDCSHTHFLQWALLLHQLVSAKQQEHTTSRTPPRLLSRQVAPSRITLAWRLVEWRRPQRPQNTFPPKLIAKILNALRERLKESAQVHSVEEIAGPVPDILFEYDQILRGVHFFDDVNGGYPLFFMYCEMKQLTRYTLWRCNMRLLQCKSAEMPAWNCWT